MGNKSYEDKTHFDILAFLVDEYSRITATTITTTPTPNMSANTIINKPTTFKQQGNYGISKINKWKEFENI